MTEKDRYGEILRNREKADEDRYMAEQDRLRLEKLRAQSGASQKARCVCPACSTPLAEIRLQSIAVEACPNCRGVWLTAEVLRELMAREHQLDRLFRAVLE